ncbi:septal ring lytic transglycosylase RlpA family protein [Maritalea sp.]|uniref:septal ring lytic transglycosylase RlpA family protein n=1 Tax=Maritalea sp. TaxID=2003361 RepID=UPI003EF25E19
MYTPMTFETFKYRARFALALALVVPALAACGGSNPLVNTKTKFSSSEYGVSASPRLTTGARVKKGGGRNQIGKAYKVAGKWYHPKDQPGYNKTGIASWYGPNFHGRLTANGEIFDQNALSAAHPTLPLPSYVRVTNLSNGSSVMVRVNDRGPFAHGRLIDLSSRTADVLQIKQKGTANVRVQYVGRAPLNGDDTRFLVASINRQTDMERGATRLAFNSNSNTTRLASMSLDQLKRPTAAPQPPKRTSLEQASGFADGTFDLLTSSYASSEKGSAGYVNDAHQAVTQLAKGSMALEQWQNDIERPLTRVDRSIGIFQSNEAAHQVGQSFALLGIVDLRATKVNGKPATQVFLEQLRQGVTRQDVNDLAEQLGLNDFVL